MSSQVAVATVAVVPVFKGFRRAVSDETDGSAKAAGEGFKRTFSKTGTDTGKKVGTGFKQAFDQTAKGVGDKELKALEAAVAKTTRALSTSRLKEQDAIGKVRVAQSQLNEATEKYGKESSQAIRAQERLATASRQLGQAHEDTEKATGDLKRAQGELARAADRAGDELKDAGKRGITGFRENVAGGVKSFAGPLIAAFAALGIGNIVADAFTQAKDFVLETITVASDLNESVNAVQVAYGDAADEVLKLGENSAKAFGLSKSDLNSYATQFSAFVSTIAGSGGDVAGTLESLVGRGTDFASVFNTDVSEALGLFQSGLAGETEPLRKYGIDLSAAAVEAYALANGIGDGTGQLTEAEKVQARYGSLMEQTNKVSGDFANTQDELANKNRVNAAAWEDIQAKLGEGFLPVAEQLAQIVGDDLLPVIAKLAEEQGPALAEAFAEILPQMVQLAQDLLPMLPGLVESFISTLPTLIDLIALVAPILADWIKNGNDFFVSIGALFDLLGGDTTISEFIGVLLGMQTTLGDIWKTAAEMGAKLGTAFFELRTTVQTKIDEVVTFIKDLPRRAVEALGNLGQTLYTSGKSLIEGFINGMKETPIGSAVSGIIDYVRGFFPNSPALRGPLAGSGWTSLGDSGGAFWDQWLSGMGGGEPPLASFTSFARGGAENRPTTSALTGSALASRSVVQNIYPQQTDARLQMRQWGREAERAFASS